MKRFITLLAILPVIAFAGKAEREYKTNELDPAVKAAQAAYKKCGCDLKITFAASISSEADMRQVKYIVEDITTGAPKYCTDAESKKAVCKMKSLEIAKGSESKFTFSGGRGVASTDGQMNPSFDMIATELDK
jgi:hypothetical protein